MAMQLGALRDALMHPGDEALASKDAEEVAAYESQFTAIKLDLAGIRGDVALVKWMLAILVAGVASLVLKTFL
jgi:hypothetical protein